MNMIIIYSGPTFLYRTPEGNFNLEIEFYHSLSVGFATVAPQTLICRRVKVETKTVSNRILVHAHHTPRSDYRELL